MPEEIGSKALSFLDDRLRYTLYDVKFFPVETGLLQQGVIMQEPFFALSAAG